MSDQSSAPQPVSPPYVVGEAYEYDAIRKALAGEFAPPYFVIHRAGEIVGLCLGLSWNPLAESEPMEVWVGKKGDLTKWGVKLSDTKGPLPVYVRREEGGKWFFIGHREVTSSTIDVEELKKRLKPPTITAISRVVYMKKISEV